MTQRYVKTLTEEEDKEELRHIRRRKSEHLRRMRARDEGLRGTRVLVKRSKYFGKKAYGVRSVRVKGNIVADVFPGKVVGAYYTLNPPFRNLAYQIKDKEGKVRVFHQIRSTVRGYKGEKVRLPKDRKKK